jgi:predicted PurR-regulated permease PerM
MKKTEIEISWATLLRILFFVVLVIVMYEGLQIILGLFLAVIISSGLETVVDFLERFHIPRTVGVILIFLAALILLSVIIYLVVPVAIVEINAAFSGLSKANAGGFGVQVAGWVSTATSKLSAEFLSSTASPFAFISKAVGSLGLAAAVIVISFYLSLGHDGVERFMKVVVPPDYEETTMKVYHRSKELLGSWFRMQLLLGLIMGFLVWGVLSLLGVKYAFLVGILAFIFELVPFLGPILTGAVAILAALLTSGTLAIITLIAFIIVQQIESNILVPLLSRRSVGLHPVIVITALLIGGTVGGLLGVIISVPAAAVLQEVVQEWSTKKKLATAA